MKKIRIMNFLLCLVLAGQCLIFPASAADSSAPTEAQTPVSMEQVITAAAKVPFGQVCIQNGCRTINGMVPLAGLEPKFQTALAAFLYEYNTDTVVYAYNPDTKLPPGNLAKVVTGIVALKYCKMDDQVTIAEGIKGRLPVSNLTMKLTNNEVVTVRDLMHGLLLTDANDAAVALAEHISGSRQSFVPLMNEWVKSIGCTGTEFATVHGVDGAASVTTARDMAKIVREACRNPDFAEAFSAATYNVPKTNVTDKERALKSMNYLRDDSTITQFYQKRVTGGVVSYEATSGACIVTTAEQGDMRYIAVLLGCNRTFAENGWQPTYYGNFEEMAEMLKFGFNDYKVNRIVYDGMSMSQFSVSNGECNAVGQAEVNIDSVVPVSAQMKNITVNFDTDGYLTAPISAGKRIATVELWYRNSCLAEAEVFAMGDVKTVEQTGVTIHSASDKMKAGSKFWSVIGTIVSIAVGLAFAYLGLNAFMRARKRAIHRRRRAERRRTR